MPRAERGRKQRDTARSAQARPKQAGRDHITQAQRAQASVTRAITHADIKQEVLVEQLGNARELQGLEKKLQQQRINAQRRLVELLLDQANTLLQRPDKGFWQALAGLIRYTLVFMQGIPLPVEPIQRAAQPLRFALPKRQQLALIETGAVHRPTTLDQIVCFVHQHCHAPLIELREAKQ